MSNATCWEPLTGCFSKTHGVHCICSQNRFLNRYSTTGKWSSIYYCKKATRKVLPLTGQHDHLHCDLPREDDWYGTKNSAALLSVINKITFICVNGITISYIAFFLFSFINVISTTSTHVSIGRYYELLAHLRLNHYSLALMRNIRQENTDTAYVFVAHALKRWLKNQIWW